MNVSGGYIHAFFTVLFITCQQCAYVNGNSEGKFNSIVHICKTDVSSHAAKTLSVCAIAKAIQLEQSALRSMNLVGE